MRVFALSSVRQLTEYGKQAPLSTRIAPAWGLLFCLLYSATGATVPQKTDAAIQEALTLHVDLSRAPQRVFEVHETIAVKPGPLTLRYPKWIPGEHAPSGPIANVAGLVIRAHGKPLPWRRDLRDMHSVHLEVPADTKALSVSFQFLPPQRSGRFGAGPSTSRDLAMLEFNQVVFYPAGQPVRDIKVKPSVTLPDGWQFASALELRSRDGDSLSFQALPLDQLVDSPLLSGRYLNTVDLGGAKTAPAHLNIMGDHGVNIEPGSKQTEHLRALGTQILRLFGRPQYTRYDFLLLLSDHAGHFGLEHRQSSDDRLPADFLDNATLFRVLAPLLPHEWIHSWNGKFRVPADLHSADFNSIRQTDLLWVYEGLTDYWASVLSARSGLWTPDYFRAALASTHNLLAHRSGRKWRNLQDTADAARLAWEGSHGWKNWRRGADFYPEGQLLWLDIDTTLRKLSHNRHSLDDLARAFFGIEADAHEIRPYRLQDIVDALNAIQPHDWASFLRQRLDYLGSGMPYHGLEHSGWRLVYTDSPGAREQDMRSLGHGVNLAASVGFAVSADGSVRDVQWQGPASAAGLVPGMKLVAVGGKEFSIDALTGAIRDAADTKQSIRLLIQDQDVYRTLGINYVGGLRYPHLERIPDSQDLLSDIIKPRN